MYCREAQAARARAGEMTGEPRDDSTGYGSRAPLWPRCVWHAAVLFPRFLNFFAHAMDFKVRRRLVAPRTSPVPSSRPTLR